jgi:hypothetical protein
MNRIPIAVIALVLLVSCNTADLPLKLDTRSPENAALDYIFAKYGDDVAIVTFFEDGYQESLTIDEYRLAYPPEAWGDNFISALYVYKTTFTANSEQFTRHIYVSRENYELPWEIFKNDVAIPDEPLDYLRGKFNELTEISCDELVKYARLSDGGILRSRVFRAYNALERHAGRTRGGNSET